MSGKLLNSGKRPKTQATPVRVDVCVNCGGLVSVANRDCAES